MFDWIGWVATAVFSASYFCSKPVPLRFVQAFAALLWVSYGLLIGARPVVAANAIVAVLAIYSAWRPGQRRVGTRSRVVETKTYL